MIPLEEKVLQLLRAPSYVPMNAAQLAREIGARGKASQQFHEKIEELERTGKIARVKKDKLVLPREADLLAGRIIFRQSGAAFLVHNERNGDPLPDRIPIRAEDTGVAMHNDQVLIRLIKDTRKRPRYRMGEKGKAVPHEDNISGRVIRILERKRETVTGTLQRSKLYYYVVADDPRIVQDILVPDPKHAKTERHPKVEEKVIVQLHEWKQRHLNPQGEIVGILGKTHTPDAEHQAILHQYHLDPTFPEPVRNEVSRFGSRVEARQLEGRLDMREKFVVTIDPDDAKDFDDALSLEKMENGDWRVGVHIADVSSYVKPRTALDREAQARGNSTYLVGEVIPMLPHELSNGLCSLVEAEDRLTKSVFLTFTPRGVMRGHSFANTVIRSRKRLTYAQALALLEEDDLDKIKKLPVPPAHQTGSTGRPLKSVPFKELKQIQHDLRKLWSFAEKMRAKRIKNGSLDLDMPEVKIYVDEEGYADRIVRNENDISHQLIEEFMLAANEMVAHTLHRVGMPCIYRVHDEPDPDKLDELREVVLLAGIQIGDLNNRKEMNRLLQALKEHEQGYTMRIQLLRSLKQACYRAEADGHYGLAKEDYTHFTSPIRRYADLIVHRIFDAFLVKQGLETAPKEPPPHYDQGRLVSIAEHISITEQNSTEAERESKKIKLLEFFERETQKKKKSTFEAIITDIKNHGMFIELTESMAFGLIHISTLDDDWWTVHNDGTELRARRSKTVFRIGDRVEVQVERIDRFKRQIDFRLTSTKVRPSGVEPTMLKPDPSPRRKKKKRSRRQT